MKSIKSLLNCIAACTLMGVAPVVKADITITVDPSASWQGFMNVFETPAHGGGYVFGNSWGTADLRATFSGTTLTLAVNDIGDPNPFWYTPSGGPGAVGNKNMDANMYVEPAAGTWTGQTLTFKGTVVDSSMLTNSAYTSVAFFKDFAPDYSSFVSVTAPMTSGNFNLVYTPINDPARHVQYGFETIGPDVWNTDIGNYGVIKIVPAVSAPSAVSITSTRSGSTLNLSFPTQAGFVYTLQNKTNLTDATWGTITTTNGTGSTAILPITLSPSKAREFYRLSIQ